MIYHKIGETHICQVSDDINSADVGFSQLIRKYKQTFTLIASQCTILYTLAPLAPHRCGFESRQGLWILLCEEAIQLAYGMSVVLLRYPFVPEIMHERAPGVFLQQ
jgi:hypothetical protein